MPHHLDTAGQHPGKGGRFDDPQSLLFLAGRFLEHVRVRNYSPRTVYRLTASGRKALENYLDHMEALIRATRAQ